MFIPGERYSTGKTLGFSTTTNLMRVEKEQTQFYEQIALSYEALSLSKLIFPVDTAPKMRSIPSAHTTQLFR
jgi:hypothetical protein